MSQPPYSGPPYGEQPPSGQPYPGQPPYQGQPQPGQPYPGQPYSGQPYPGQPNPDVPTSVPPGYPPTQAYPGGADYGQPQYGQPQYGDQAQYGQPQYGQPQYGDQGYGVPGFPPPVPPKKKSRALPIVLVSVAVVLVLCVGGSVAIYLAAKNKVDKATKGAVTTSSSTGPTGDPTTAPPTKNASSVKIAEPKTLGGRPKLTGSQFDGVADQLKNSLKQLPNSTNSVGALYGTVAKQNIVVVAAAQAPIDDPAGFLNQTFYGAGIGGLKIDNIVTASTGSLGGNAKCGSASAHSVNMAICSWADDGSMGMMIWYYKSVGTAKSEFPALRAEVEQKA